MSRNALALQAHDVTFAYKPKNPVLRGISLEVAHGDVLCVLGPSGCGKSTLLKLIAGLLSPSSGHISIDGKNQAGVPTFERDIGFVFQRNALFPHLSVYDNIAFPFRHGQRTDGRIGVSNWQSAVEGMLRLVQMEAFRDRSIVTLSGGQQQRVALARALVYRPSLLLLDEPLAALDNALRRELLDLFIDLHSEFGNTFMFVTHDEREAARIATHVAIIGQDHTIVQTGKADHIYSAPATPEVALLLDEWNLFDGQVSDTHNQDVSVEMPWGQKVDLHVKHPTLHPGSAVRLGIRVSNIHLTSTREQSEHDAVTIKLRISRVRKEARNTVLVCDVVGASGIAMRVRVEKSDPCLAGQTLVGVVDHDSIKMFS